MKIHSNMEPDGDEPSQEDADFARQLASVLRTAESPRAGFDERVRAAIQSAHSAPTAASVLRLNPREAAWRRPRSFTLPLVAWGALAASFAAVVGVGTLSLARMPRPVNDRAGVGQALASRPIATTVSHDMRDTVYVVRFVLTDSRAHTVSLVGDFNAWAKRATPLSPVKPGIWSTQVALPAGRHEYAFLVDGKRWVADPESEHLADDFNTQSSVITVGSS